MDDELANIMAPLVAVANAEGQVVLCNEAAARMCLCEVGRPFWECIAFPQRHEEVRQEILASIDGLTTRRPMFVETALPERHAVIAWTFTPLRYGDPVVNCSLAIGIDLFMRQATIENIMAENDRMRTLINAMPDPVYFKDGEGRWLHVNAAALNTFGLRTSVYYGRTNLEVADVAPFFSSALQQCDDSDEAAWEARTMMRGDEPIMTEDGQVHYFDTWKIPLFYPDGRRRGMVALERDITQRKLAEKTLIESESRMRSILDAVPNGIVLLDREHHITFANRAAGYLLEHRIDDLVGKAASTLGPWLQIGYDDVSDAGAGPVLRLPIDTPLSDLPVNVQHRDGHRLTLEVSATPLAEGLGATILTFQDVTARARVEQLKSDFLRMASHELRTPLTSLRLLLDRSLRRVERGRSVPSQHFARMLRHADRLTDLIDRLLDAARMERDDRHGNHAVADLHALVASVVDDFRNLNPQRTITLHNDNGESATAWVDRLGIEQVLINLLDNALKYSNGEVDVALTSSVDAVRVQISDSGETIAPEHCGDLFSRFHRVYNEATLSKPGLGLGLFICRDIIGKHHGSISYCPKSGGGNMFAFELPRRLPQEVEDSMAPVHFSSGDSPHTLHTTSGEISTELG